MRVPHTIRLAQTDAAGVIFGPELPRLFHDAFEAFLEARGQPIAKWLRDPRIALPLVHLSCDFRAPLRAGDRVTIEVAVQELAPRRVTIRYTLRKGTAVAAEGSSVHVAVSKKSGRATRIPASLARALKPNGA